MHLSMIRSVASLRSLYYVIRSPDVSGRRICVGVTPPRQMLHVVQHDRLWCPLFDELMKQDVGTEWT